MKLIICMTVHKNVPPESNSAVIHWRCKRCLFDKLTISIIKWKHENRLGFYYWSKRNFSMFEL